MKRVWLVLALVAIIGSIWYLESRRSTVPGGSGGGDIELTPVEDKASRYPPAKELVAPAGFLNTEPFQIADLIGDKVVLVDFWTYSCINCQRTTPYLNAWYDKYRDAGLEIVGVHSPEFDFEKDPANVAAAVEAFNIQYPVVLDNDFGTWRAYGNRYWPRKYLIDIDGYIVYDHIGEGAYEETEARIQAALAERAARLGMSDAVPGGVAQPSDAVTEIRALSPEIYFGSDRNEYLGNGIAGRPGTQTFVLPARREDNTVYLEGDWAITEEFAQNETAGARIFFRYQAMNMFMVAGADQAVNVRVLRDGVEVRTLTIEASTLYTITEDDEFGEHEIELIIESPGLRVYTFTFG